MALNREYIKALCEAYFPDPDHLYAVGSVGMDHITKDWSHKGTTCGFLPHWLLWKTGCTDGKLVNRYEPDAAFRFTNGQNLTKLSAYQPAWVPFFAGNPGHIGAFRDGTRRPSCGDIVIIQGKPHADGSDSGHVFVALDGGAISGNECTYYKAETGQKTNSMEQAGRRNYGRFLFDGKKWVSLDNFAEPLERYITGWLNVANCPFGSFPDKGVYEYLSAWAQKSSAGQPPASSVIGIWYITCPAESLCGWYYMFHKGFRLFYAEASQPSVIRGAGYWYTENGHIYIAWATEAGTHEDIAMQVDGTGLGVDGYGAPFGAQRVSTTPTAVLTSYVSSIGLPMGMVRV